MEHPNAVFTICCWLDFKVTGNSRKTRFDIDLKGCKLSVRDRTLDCA